MNSEKTPSVKEFYDRYTDLSENDRERDRIKEKEASTGSIKKE